MTAFKMRLFWVRLPMWIWKGRHRALPNAVCCRGQYLERGPVFFFMTFNVTLCAGPFCHLSEEENYLGKWNLFRNTFFFPWDHLFCLAVTASSPYKWKQYWRSRAKIEPKSNLRSNERANGKVPLIHFPLTTDPAVPLVLHVRTVWDTKGRNPISMSPTGEALNAKPAAV